MQAFFGVIFLVYALIRICMDNNNNGIQAVIGLGNPGKQYTHNRHNIGFRILDTLAQKYQAEWRAHSNVEYANILLHGHNLLLIKPQTFMNNSGTVMSYISKKGIKAEMIMVVHDELEKPFGSISIKKGGSARGHNGLRSLIATCGDQFMRLRFGIGRPLNKNDVSTYVLSDFNEGDAVIREAIDEAVMLLEEQFSM